MPNTKGKRSARGRSGPSIRSRIYFLVAIPLLTVIGLYAFVLYTTVGDAINLDRAPNLINATSVPAATFDVYIQNERRASLVYLAAPTAANRAQLDAVRAATMQALPTFQAKMTSGATTQSATTSETQEIAKMVSDVNGLDAVRAGIDSRTITPAAAFAAFSAVLVDELHLFLTEVASLTNVTAATQSLAVIDETQAREALLQEDALLSAALAAHRLTPATRIQITELAGARQAAISSALTRFDSANLAAFEGPLNSYAPPATQSRLTTLEDAVAADPTPFPPFSAAQWDPVANAVSSGYFHGGVGSAETQVSLDTHVTRVAWLRVALAGGLGLLGLLLSILFSTLIGRRIIRRLRRLRESALTLANDQLPDVVARLRRGEDVPVDAAAPAPQFGRGDEIGQVGQAFEAARQTAIQAAVGEARLRRGINDVFRNLARRSQSLLHRQLTVLDGMERRTTEPEVLEDLFRLDHLTTRMRRHSEGLIILSGAAPGRGWVHPVRLIDILRAAAAEVEDYSRVSVTCPSPAALAGPTVADVIHLLAELIENATTLSPPYTPVRVTGDLVANGFAVEIEDRGLGMSEQRYAELNGRLAEPPEFDVFNSEQLGLFVVGQLAKRHGIRVTLRPSPFGGTTVIALIPPELVVLEEGYMEGLPAGMSAFSPAWTAGRHAALSEETMVPSSTQRTQVTGGQPWGALTQGPQANGSPGAAAGVSDAAGTGGLSGPSGPGQGAPDPFDAFAPSWGSPETAQGTSQQQAGTPDAGQGQPFGGDPFSGQAQESPPYGGQPFGSDQYGSQGYGGAANENQAAHDRLVWPRDGGSPATGPAPGNGTPGSSGTGGYTAGGLPSRRPSFGGTAPGEVGSGGSATDRPWPYDWPETAANGTGQPAAHPSSGPDEPAYPQTGPSYPPSEPSYPSAESYPQAGSPFPEAGPASGKGGHPYPEAEPAANELTYKGLPRRKRQASLAPQLRDNRAASPPASTGESTVANRSPEDIRTALSAMQRGWQQGRAPDDDASRADSTSPATADSGPAASDTTLSEQAAEGTRAADKEGHEA
jgi:signal transduction histidine kinase